uniref:(northern house mosquito) hypothetical protein n=1 Tax=Culex pipiens TaxID=7175 RepID=A0A8D8AQR7_CULPI
MVPAEAGRSRGGASRSESQRHSHHHQQQQQHHHHHPQHESSSHWSTQRSVSVHIAAVKESCTDDEIIADDDEAGQDGEVKYIEYEYIELMFDADDPTKYRECLI